MTFTRTDLELMLSCIDSVQCEWDEESKLTELESKIRGELQRNYGGPARAGAFCCDELERATERGTCNEAYDCAVYGAPGKWTIGCNLEPIRFCPWCGGS